MALSHGQLLEAPTDPIEEFKALVLREDSSVGSGPSRWLFGMNYLQLWYLDCREQD